MSHFNLTIVSHFVKHFSYTNAIIVYIFYVVAYRRINLDARKQNSNSGILHIEPNSAERCLCYYQIAWDRKRNSTDNKLGHYTIKPHLNNPFCDEMINLYHIILDSEPYI